jgi:hypothetical protein
MQKRIMNLLVLVLYYTGLPALCAPDNAPVRIPFIPELFSRLQP